MNLTDLMTQVLDTNTLCLGQLLRSDGFTYSGHLVQHAGTGVTISVNQHGYRVSFLAESAPQGLGIVDLPLDTVYGVVTQVALALHTSGLN